MLGKECPLKAENIPEKTVCGSRLLRSSSRRIFYGLHGSFCLLRWASQLQALWQKCAHVEGCILSANSVTA
ncbi:hypothetical protein NQZ68_013271 [Dissostichus eleginoides]|nr:hypothetical protein NQZ68_013271 [Dissostichus eleginoides]